MNKNQVVKIGLSIILSYSFIFVLINGDYYIEHRRFIEIGREDLIARLPFLSHSFAMICFPILLICLVGIMILYRKRYFKNVLNKFTLLTGPFLVGALFYVDILPYLISGTLGSLLISLIIFLISGYFLRMSYLKN